MRFATSLDGKSIGFLKCFTEGNTTLAVAQRAVQPNSIITRPESFGAVYESRDL